MSRAAGAPPQSLCLLRLSAIGDVINAVPVVRSIQRAWPDTAIIWIIGADEAALVADLPGIEFVTFDKRAGLRGLRALRRRLRGRRFDVLLLMQYALRASLVGACVRATTRLGFDRAHSRDGHGLFINRRIEPPAGPHVVDVYFAFLETLGIAERVLDWSLPVPEAERARARQWLPSGKRYLVINPCASNRYKEWRPARYAAVADAAVTRYGFTVVLSGGPPPREQAMAAAVAAAMRAPAINLAGQTSLKGMLALLERADLLISPDSGPAHMASATTTDVIALLATSAGQRTGPYPSRRWNVDRFDAVAQHFTGRPANALRWGRRLERAGAMDLIRVDDVLERLDAWHAERGHSSARI